MINKKTAVEWLVEQLEEKGDARETPSIRNIQFNIDTNDYLELKRQAKQMEKEQMIEFAQEVFRNRYNKIYESLGSIADDIYNETYGGDNAKENN